MFRVRIFVLYAVAIGGALSKKSEAGRRKSHEGVCFVWKGLFHLAVLLTVQRKFKFSSDRRSSPEDLS